MKKKVILFVLFLSFIALTIIWHEEIINLFHSKKEMPMMAMRIDEAPVKESIVTTTVLNLQNILTGIIAMVNAVFGCVYVIQKVFGKR